MEQDSLNGMINLRQRVELTTRPRVQGFHWPMFDGYLLTHQWSVQSAINAGKAKVYNLLAEAQE